MDPEQRSDYESQSLTLKRELKQWESQWAKKHKGEKPSQEDIKKNPDIGMLLQTLTTSHYARFSRDYVGWFLTPVS